MVTSLAHSLLDSSIERCRGFRDAAHGLYIIFERKFRWSPIQGCGKQARPFIGLSIDDREQIEKTAEAWVSLREG